MHAVIVEAVRGAAVAAGDLLADKRGPRLVPGIVIPGNLVRRKTEPLIDARDEVVVGRAVVIMILVIIGVFGDVAGQEDEFHRADDASDGGRIRGATEGGNVLGGIVFVACRIVRTEVRVRPDGEGEVSRLNRGKREQRQNDDQVSSCAAHHVVSFPTGGFAPGASVARQRPGGSVCARPKCTRAPLIVPATKCCLKGAGHTTGDYTGPPRVTGVAGR